MQGVSGDFPRRKLVLALAIMGVGMLIALAWAAWQGWGLGKGYPSNSFLFEPRARFNDFTDWVADAGRDNPYADPFGIYFPPAWMFYRVFAWMPPLFAITLYLFAGLALLYLFLVAALAGVVQASWERIVASLLLLLLSYPVIFVVDRANLELYLAGFVAGTVYFFGRSRYGWGALCLVVSVCFKLYPVVLFVLLFRQRRVGLIALGLAAFLLAFYLSLAALSVPMGTGLELFGRDLGCFKKVNFYQNYDLEGCSSLWNVYKIGVITAGRLGLIAPVDFSFDNRFIIASYTVYTAVMALVCLGLVGFVCRVEREFLRGVIVLLLYLAVFTPLGADYRLLYANIALVTLIVIRTRRPWDLTALVLLALAMVPKKEIFLTYVGKTETSFADVSIQVVLNPLLVLAALIFLVYDGCRGFDAGWSRRRGRSLVRSLTGRSWTRALLRSKNVAS